MNYSRSVNNVIQKLKIHEHSWKLIINRGFKFSNSVLPGKSCHNEVNKCKFVQPNFQWWKNSNFSTTVTARTNSQGPNQKREKMKDYLTFGITALFIGLVAYFYCTMKLTYDEVYIDTPEKKK